jgi:hydroxymethylpyrimidine/phosphomethylpyrimidine kinase
MNGRVLVVAGSDSGGGAGIQADIKTITALGAYAATAITALTAQNTETVLGIVTVAPDFVRRQMEAVLGDIGADCVKTGMLVDGAVIDAIADCLAASAPAVPLVVDPVLLSSSGTRLLDERAIEVLKRRLIARARLVTPNLPEVAALTGLAVASLDDMRRAADRLLALGAAAVMIKGGHLAGDRLIDLVVDGAQSFVIEASRIATRSTHGTGCTLASAIAAGIAQGMTLRPAIERAHAYVQRAIATAPGLGRGHGPLNHAHPCEPIR